MKSIFSRVVSVALTSCLAIVPAALAQDATIQTFETGRELVASPGQYVNKAVAIHVGYCFFDDTNTHHFFCIGDSTPFEVEAPSMPAGALRDAIMTNCNDIEGIEHNPTERCAYSFKFVPTSYKTIISDYVVNDRVQSDKPIVHFEAGGLEPYR